MTALRAHTMPRISKGFTLIEVMIVVTLIGILAGIAYPAYQDYVLKGRRAEGRTALLEFMHQQERYATQKGKYALVNSGDTSSFSTVAGMYKLKAVKCDGTGATATESCPGPSAEGAERTCIKLVAEPQRSDPKVNNLILCSTGKKTCDGTSKDDKKVCWP